MVPTKALRVAEQSHLYDLEFNPELFEDTPPCPGRVAIAISAFPYSLRTAVFDIVDNSIQWGADGVSVEFEHEDNELKSLTICDNGTGISADVLNEVLRAGSETQHLYGERSLSRYGVGLKGAAFALGQKLTIYTRAHGQPIRRRSIDLSLIQEKNRWLQEKRDPDKEEAAAFEVAMKRLPGAGSRETGTVISIENLNVRSRDLKRQRNEIVREAGAVYSKFLSAGKVALKIDGTEIVAVDPLHRDNVLTTTIFPREEIKLGDNLSVYFSGVALPHPHQLDSELAKRYRYTSTNQGVYVFRNGRMLMGGLTLDLFTKDFHLNAFRAELEYTSAADEHIQVDVAKSTVVLSPMLRERLQELVKTCTKTAGTLWREKDVLTESDIRGLFDESNRLIDSRVNLLVETAQKRRAKERARRAVSTDNAANATTTDTNIAKPSTTTSTAKPKATDRTKPAFLVPVNSLPDGVLYRPIHNGELNALVVEINLEHPFAKAVFSVSPSDRQSLPRKATTAVQHLLYVMGFAEDGLIGDPENEALLRQFRQYASLNLRALLD
jgi:hypothetical protein